MKTIGLLGGMSWESTVTYYRLINEYIKNKLGGFHSAKCVLYSVDFKEIEECQAKGDWAKSAEILSAAAQSLERAGADFLVICTNTMHLVANDIQKNIHIPLMHIAVATANELKKAGIRKTALLGTKFTMEQDFYKNVLIEQGVEVIVPNEVGRKIVNDTIYNELCLGSISPVSKQKFLQIIEQLKNDGAEAVILGCTEIGLLVQQADTDMKLFDTALIHAEQAAKFAIEC